METANKLQTVESPVIGRMYHISWAKVGCAWNLLEINGVSCTMITPRTRKKITVKLTDLRNIKKHTTT